MYAVEPTPGLYVNSFVPPGQAYKLNAAAFGVEGLGGGPFAFALSEADWLRMQGPDLERLLDDLTHRYAEHGVRGLQQWLGTIKEQPTLWSNL